MTQADKELLLKDLCARLPYKVKVQDTYYKSLEPASIWLLDLNAQCVRLFADEGYQNIEYIKPYLFPLDKINGDMWSEYLATCFGGNASFPTLKSFEWCDEHHVDYRGLIHMGLAIDATGLNIY